MTDVIEEAWESYRANVVPRQAGRVQLRETRRAFYAGAAALITEIARVADLDDREAEQLALRNLSRELEQFPRDVMEGRT